MLTVARNDQGQFLWNRSGSTPWPEPVLCALLSVMIVSDILLKQQAGSMTSSPGTFRANMQLPSKIYHR